MNSCYTKNQGVPPLPRPVESESVTLQLGIGERECECVQSIRLWCQHSLHSCRLVAPRAMKTSALLTTFTCNAKPKLCLQNSILVQVFTKNFFWNFSSSSRMKSWKLCFKGKAATKLILLFCSGCYLCSRVRRLLVQSRDYWCLSRNRWMWFSLRRLWGLRPCSLVLPKANQVRMCRVCLNSSKSSQTGKFLLLYMSQWLLKKVTVSYRKWETVSRL